MCICSHVIFAVFCAHLKPKQIAIFFSQYYYTEFRKIFHPVSYETKRYEFKPNLTGHLSKIFLISCLFNKLINLFFFKHQSKTSSF